MILGLTIVNPALLYAGTAMASIPVIIHLLNRLRFKRIVWAAMEFLLAAHRKNARRVRIEQLILLIIRTLIVLLLAAAVARPILEGLLAGLGRSSTHRVLVIDDSFSMGAQAGVSGGKTAMKQVVEQADWLMKHFEKRDGVSVFLAGSRPHARIGSPSFDHENVVKEIEKLTVSDSATDMVGTLEEARKVLADSKQERKVVYILTDNTQAAWEDEGASDLRDVAAAVSEMADIVVVDVSGGTQSNLAIGEFYPERAVVTEDVLSTFRIEVENLSDQALDGVVVNVTVDGTDVRPVRFGRVAPRKVETRKWAYTFDRPGEHAMEARIKDIGTADTLAVDSRRFLALTVKKALDVLIVDGEPRTDTRDGEADYLRLALDPRTRDQDRETPFLPTWIRDSEFDASQLNDVDVVMLANVGSLSDVQQNLLRRFVQDGGALMVFLGDQVQAGLYNLALYENGTGLLPAFLAETRGTTEPGHEEQYTTFDIGHFDHPALGAFRESGVSGGLDVVRIYKYYQLKLPVEGTDTDVILYLKSGDPAIVEKQYGRGRVVLWATTADAEWTNFPRLPAYLELIHELMDHVTPDILWRYNRLVDNTTSIPVSAAHSRDTVVVSMPRHGQVQLTPENIGEDRFAVKVADLGQSGVYTVDGAGLEQRRLAVNVDVAESSLDHLTEDELSERLGHVSMLYVSGQSGLEEAFKAQAAAGGWARNLLYGMLALLLVETFLAWFFNRGA